MSRVDTAQSVDVDIQRVPSTSGGRARDRKWWRKTGTESVEGAGGVDVEWSRRRLNRQRCRGTEARLVGTEARLIALVFCSTVLKPDFNLPRHSVKIKAHNTAHVHGPCLLATWSWTWAVWTELNGYISHSTSVAYPFWGYKFNKILAGQSQPTISVTKMSLCRYSIPHVINCTFARLQPPHIDIY